MMGWAYALMSLMGLVLALCAWVVWRDAALRGRRIERNKIVREKITRTLPDHWMKDFKDRTYPK